MKSYENRHIVRLTNLPELVVRHIYCGCFVTHSKSTLPVNRLIYIFQSGEEQSSICDKECCCALQPHVWLFIPAFHEVIHDQKPGLELVSIHFSYELYSQLEIFSECKALCYGMNSELAEHFEMLLDEHATFGDAMQCKMLLWHFLGLITMKRELPLDKLSNRFSFFALLLETFGQHPYMNFSVGEMAKIMKMGKESFIKYFVQQTGVAPKTFFNRRRAVTAARELADPRVTIREISARLNFSNEFYFSRFFKQHMGISPSEYRKNITI